MIDSSDPIELLQRGQAAARVGRRDEARDSLRRVVQLTPDNPQAWLALAGVEDDPAEKIACFERVLELDPENVEARLGLEMLQPELDQITLAQESPSYDDHDHDLELELVMSAASRQLDESVGPPPADETPLDDEVLYCANHPNVETMLRCNRCSKLICTRCAVRTPVGYRCRECVGQQQATFYTGGVADYVIGGAIALILGGIASYLMLMLRGAWFIALILGPTIGIAIAELVRLAVRRRRSQYLWLAVAIGFVAGSTPALLLGLATFNLWLLLSLGLFMVLAVGAASARLR